MPRKTGRDAGNGRSLSVAKAQAMGDRATIETLRSDEVTEAMTEAGIEICRAFAERETESDDGEGRDLVRDIYQAIGAARPR